LRPSTWLPLAALALMVALTVWLNQLVQAPAGRSGKLRHDPDVVVEKFNARKLGEDGRVLYTLVARKMVHYPDDDSALLEDVTVEAFEPKQPKLTATADQGRLEKGGDVVQIEGNVVVIRDADGKDPAARFTTDRLTVLPDAGIARTSSEVTLVSANGRTVATGMEIDNRARTLKLERVHATYKPARSCAPAQASCS
jgi:lipopolysaccharide export system protein LptC